MKNKIFFDEFQNYVEKNIISFFSREMREKFEIYFYELIEWNKMFNLISFKNEENLIYRHFCDSLYSAKVINDILSKKIPNQHKYFPAISLKIKSVDLGTGAGMPGVPLKIVFPNIKLTLVESTTKKCKFLKNINNKLGLDVEILNTRAEDIGQNPSYRQSYDFVLSRAVSKLSPNLEISIPLLKIGGYFIVHKTENSIKSTEAIRSNVGNALKHLGARIEKMLSYNLYQQKLNYCLLIFKKYKDTPLQFPRKSGIPEKNPL